ncbi:5'-methylthioadenosine/S-adenosylhomocysteine nucleosidase [Calothrix sp. NIES-4071]|nr:5'-methylthioadenosine/S-adenosylhomocysteine nucleosidase [Calothrix sp. NIES-4071]BAZ56970.1 5'-methylthioadenosine/S-adenosylhomocysteine nucleosidase [Calothrix sp. NIES-4105]
MNLRRRDLLLGGAAALVGSQMSGRSNKSTAKSTEPLIAVVSAYPPETAANEKIFLGNRKPYSITTYNGTIFKQVRFEGHNLLLFSAGMSMVNAAMNTQLAISKFPISQVLFAGVAGGINPAYDVGDVVIPERWYHHSESVYAQKISPGKYLLPEYYKQKAENYDFIFPDYVMVKKAGMTEAVEKEFFAADPQLLKIAKQAIKQVPVLTCNIHSQAKNRPCQLHVGGNGISGSVFLDNREYRDWASRVWQAQCVDMESTAIAQVCWTNQKPFLIVRSLSDLAGGQDGANPIDQTEKPVAESAAIVLREIIRC